MGTRRLTITEEAYERLRALKRTDESFTDTVLRLTDRERVVMARFGDVSDVDGFRAAVDDTREELDVSLREHDGR